MILHNLLRWITRRLVRRRSDMLSFCSHPRKKVCRDNPDGTDNPLRVCPSVRVVRLLLIWPNFSQRCEKKMLMPKAVPAETQRPTVSE